MYIKIAHKPGDRVWLKDDDEKIVEGTVREVILSTDSEEPQFTVLVQQPGSIVEYQELIAYDPSGDWHREDSDPYRYVYATEGMARDYDLFCTDRTVTHNLTGNGRD